jgi:hypothetical protein
MSSFHLFPNLPVELRLKIWDHAVLNNPPQVIDIYTIAFVNPQEDDPDIDINAEIVEDSCYDWLHQFIPIQKTPVHLHVCSESRAVALQHYQLGFHTCSRSNATGPPASTECQHRDVAYTQKRQFYFNPIRDVVFYQDFSGAVLSMGVGGYQYVCTADNMTDVWFADTITIQSSRFVGTNSMMFLVWMRPNPLCPLPDLSDVEMVLVLMDKDHLPQLQDQYWSGELKRLGIAMSETGTWEENKAYLEGKFAQVIQRWNVRGGSDEIQVKVHLTMEDIVEEVRGL